MVRKIEIETYIEDILEEGLDPRIVSYHLLERFAEGEDEDEDEVEVMSRKMETALEDLRDRVEKVSDEAEEIKGEVNTAETEDDLAELMQRIETYQDRRDKLFGDPDKGGERYETLLNAMQIAGEDITDVLLDADREVNACYNKVKVKYDQLMHTAATGQRTTQTIKASVHGTDKEEFQRTKTPELDRLNRGTTGREEPGVVDHSGDGRSFGGVGTDTRQSSTDKTINKNKKRLEVWTQSRDFLSHLKLTSLFRDPKSRLYAGVASGLVLTVVITNAIPWVKNRDIRKIGILATNRAMMKADMEGLAVKPGHLKKAFKMMTRSPLIKRKIKIYLERAKNVGMQFQAVDNVANYVAEQLIVHVKKTGVAKVEPMFNVIRPTDPPTARGYIHPPGFADSIGLPDSGIGGDQEGTEYPGGSYAG